ncbi:hypothetical protein B0T24DRAFT_167500 [Lasiosphaeria ovina]|uniref:Uncharacterized protein n=1 Tax=Lasiosphaeria ovina TaxID=92902 RepID=A0AAE0NDY2_9PEZI|nr:hypothetical protein B0T24DRAFT_167500 [Lasiosphaeria ovina]
MEGDDARASVSRHVQYNKILNRGLVLPQELCWLVVQELADHEDFNSLFHCAQASRGLANLALPLLYSFHESSPASNAHILFTETLVCLWRSIISSSMGGTLYPYCRWIKTLQLTALHSFLDDLARENGTRRAQFFSPPLHKLQIRKDRGLNLDAIVITMADMVIKSIKAAADEEDKVVGLTTLDAHRLPNANLPSWVADLSRLITLMVGDGEVLNASVAEAIRANCPSFNELVCYSCRNGDVQLAAFFRALAPNTLESFTIRSTNDIGAETFRALSRHALSLNRLRLFSLEQSALESLHNLSDCLGLKSLTLEANFQATRFAWENTSKKSLEDVTLWLRQCTSLKDLEFRLVPNSATILADVLKTPEIRLTSLYINLVDVNDAFYTSLACQHDLRHLKVLINDEDLLEVAETRHALFADSICSCTKLRELNTNELFTLEDVTKIVAAVPNLEDLRLDGDRFDDDFLKPLSSLLHLKQLFVFGFSIFSFEGLLNFLARLSIDGRENHEGLQISIENQAWDVMLSEKEERWLTRDIEEFFGGRLDIIYRNDPDELHESDFSDFSD